jgi:hypothetical protein
VPGTRYDAALRSGCQRRAACRWIHRRGLVGYLPTPWHFLYFFPDPHGHGSFRPTSGTAAVARASGPCELVSVGVGPPDGGATRGGGPMNRSSAPLVGADWCAIAVGGGGGGARGKPLTMVTPDAPGAGWTRTVSDFGKTVLWRAG